jgi:hypothetical protein
MKSHNSPCFFYLLAVIFPPTVPKAKTQTFQAAKSIGVAAKSRQILL